MVSCNSLAEGHKQRIFAISILKMAVFSIVFLFRLCYNLEKSMRLFERAPALETFSVSKCIVLPFQSAQIPSALTLFYLRSVYHEPR